LHIPDGYLSPQTFLPAYAAIVPFWAAASARLKRELRLRQVPLLALGAAFCYIIMMFNVPIIGKTTGHAVGSVLIAILLGPWAAMLATSLALIVQAFVNADGGVTAIGANCLTMAVLMPFSGWGVYRLIAGAAPVGSRRHVVGAAVGGYVGLNVSALATAVLFGIQPLIARDQLGALYCPFDLSLALPAMIGEHLLVFGWVEALVTGLVVVYLQRSAPSLLPAPQAPAAPHPRQLVRRLAIGMLILVLLTPLGLYLPALFRAGDAWGEWAPVDVPAQLQAHGQAADRMPPQLARLSALWKGAPLPDYALPGQESAPLPLLSLGYIFSAAMGVVLLVGVVLAGRRWLARKEPDAGDPRLDASADD
jgi:cobalt/nickel transport system permease protein